jgi:hypothetical protein
MNNNKKQREDIIKKWKDSGLLDNLEYDDIINPTFKKGFKVHGSILTQEDNNTTENPIKHIIKPKQR